MGRYLLIWLARIKTGLSGVLQSSAACNRLANNGLEQRLPIPGPFWFDPFSTIHSLRACFKTRMGPVFGQKAAWQARGGSRCARPLVLAPRNAGPATRSKP